jgi:predicted transposase YbfD/YdcC
MAKTESKSTLALLFHLSKLEDPRTGQNFQHSFVEIVFIAVCAVICGCEHWTKIEDYGLAKESWLRTILTLKEGIPSHDTFRRIFCILRFEEFQKVFFEWTGEIKRKLKIKEDQICIDGKTLRGSFCKSKSVKALHRVNAWSTATSLSLGQVPTEEKSNEITAIPELLKLIDLKGCLVSIDAMGCQTDIAEKIIQKGGNYLLAVKENQEKLLKATEILFERSATTSQARLPQDDYSREEKNIHGRDERRECRVIYLEKAVPFFPQDNWPNIHSIIRIQKETLNRSTKKRQTKFDITYLMPIKLQRNSMKKFGLIGKLKINFIGALMFP